MTLEVRGNVNYAATVVRVKHIIELDNCDNVVAVPVLGYQSIVGKDTQVGDLLVVFPAETQLSEAFASAANLFRHSEKNADPNAKGYLEDNRRIRAMKFRGHRSDALAMPLLSFIRAAHAMGATTISEALVTGEGVAFDHVDGIEVCRKYVIKTRSGPTAATPQEKAFKRVDTKFLPEHYDTANYFRAAERGEIGDDEYVVVTQKVHGTSVRIGHTIVKRQLTWLERLAKRLGIGVAETEHDYVFGSRKVIKDANNPNQNHFYDTDLWSREGAKYADLLPQNVVLYGELIGWVDENTPIQPNYTYDVPNGEAHLYVYRVAVVTDDGNIFDLSWDAVKEFCNERGLRYVPEMWAGFHKDFPVEEFLDKNFRKEVASNEATVPLSPDSPCDEGVCIRVEGLAPRILKAKSPVFLGHETAMLDKEVVDLESIASEDAGGE